jgi:hypothetical protein
LSKLCLLSLEFLSLHGGCSILAPRRKLMPGALVPERHNTLDGKGWSPMLSRLLGVFVFLQYPVSPSFLAFATYITGSYRFNRRIMTTIIFIPFVVGSCSQIFWASFCNLLDSLFNQLFSWAFEAGRVRINIR